MRFQIVVMDPEKPVQSICFRLLTNDFCRLDLTPFMCQQQTAHFRRSASLLAPSTAQGKFLRISLSRVATMVGYQWIGRPTPTAFISTYRTIAAALFPTTGIIMRTKTNSPRLCALWNTNIKKLNTPRWMNEHFFLHLLFLVPLTCDLHWLLNSHFNYSYLFRRLVYPSEQKRLWI